jgi:hypothetical protein
MNLFKAAVGVVARTADATTAAAGAVGGAAVNGVIGGVQGAVGGLRNGVASGSHSTPAAALTFGTLAATGLVEWPLVVAVGGTALVVRQLNHRREEPPIIAAVEPTPINQASRPRKASGTASKSRPRKSTTTRRTTTARRS